MVYLTRIKCYEDHYWTAPRVFPSIRTGNLATSRQYQPKKIKTKNHPFKLIVCSHSSTLRYSIVALRDSPSSLIALCPRQKHCPTWWSRSCNPSEGAALSSAWCLCLCRGTHFYPNSWVQDKQVDSNKQQQGAKRLDRQRNRERQNDPPMLGSPPHRQKWGCRIL